MRRLLATTSPPRRAVLVLALPVLVAAGLAAPARAAQKVHSAEELFQPFLQGDLAHWLVGPIGRLATEDEITQYLRLKTPDEANQFIEQFWAKRDPDPSKPGNAVRELFESRAAEADQKFVEAAVAGHRTDRGTIWVLYGEPEKMDHEQGRDVSGPDVELWHYSKQAEAGLDGRRPEKEYRFWKKGDLTTFYSQRESERDASDPRRRRQTGIPGEPGEPGRGGVPDPAAPAEPP
jgi:GWxTD domain-containing protein